MVTNVQQAILTDIIENARRGSLLAVRSIEHIKKQAEESPVARECLTWMREYIVMHPPHNLSVLE